MVRYRVSLLLHKQRKQTIVLTLHPPPVTVKPTKDPEGVVADHSGQGSNAVRNDTVVAQVEGVVARYADKL
jgi:hypothetical protein